MITSQMGCTSQKGFNDPHQLLPALMGGQGARQSTRAHRGHSTLTLTNQQSAAPSKLQMMDALCGTLFEVSLGWLCCWRELYPHREFRGYCTLKPSRIRRSVKSIGNEAFAGCCKLRKIAIPNLSRKSEKTHFATAENYPQWQSLGELCFGCQSISRVFQIVWNHGWGEAENIRVVNDVLFDKEMIHVISLD